MSTLEALRLLAHGDRAGARRAAFETLQQDKYDLAAWQLLAHLARDDEERALCLQRAEATEQRLRDGAVRPPDHEPLEIAVVAVNKEHYPDAVRALSLREPLRLRRELSNPHDPNAIRVERLNGQPCGYVPRQVAALLAPEMAPDTDEGLTAFVTELGSNYYDGRLSLRVAISLPALLRDRLRATLQPERARRLAYSLSRTDHYRYIVLNCSERRLQRIAEGLEEAGFPVELKDRSTRAAANGRTYRWFIRVEPRCDWDDAQIERFFRERFGVLSDDELERRAVAEEQRLRATIRQMEHSENHLLQKLSGERRRLEELQKEYDAAHEIVSEYAEENRSKSDEIARLKNRIESYEGELNATEMQRKETERQLAILTTAGEATREEGELGKLLRVLFPTIEWLRDSLAVLTENYHDPTNALKAIHLIACDPQQAQRQLRPKGLQKAKGWREIHLSTGQSHDGRLYFRSQGEGTALLVSYKRSQDSDIEYLCKC